nr:MAG TPA: hypothetical protein [Caudoviricetes sp.]DAS62803.1 MAG TPA: hypothetical protein [Caudoviricetes sp.]
MKRIFGRAPCERKRTQPVRCRSDVTLPTPRIIQDERTI